MSMFSSSRGQRVSMPGQSLPGSSWNPTSAVKPMAAPRPMTQAWNPQPAVYNAPPPQRSQNAQLASATPAAQPPVAAPPPAPTPVVVANADPLAMERSAAQPDPAAGPVRFAPVEPDTGFRLGPDGRAAPMDAQTFEQFILKRVQSGQPLNIFHMTRGRNFGASPQLLQAIQNYALGRGWNYQPAPAAPVAALPPQDTTTSVAPLNAATSKYQNAMAQPDAQPAAPASLQVKPMIRPGANMDRRGPGTRRTGNGIFTGR